MRIGTEAKRAVRLEEIHEHLGAAKALAVDLEACLYEGGTPTAVLEEIHEHLGAAKALAVDLEACLYEGERGLPRIGGIAA